EVRFEGPGLIGFGDICSAGDEVRVVGVLAPSPCLGLAERPGCPPGGRERALYRKRHSVVFGVTDPAVAASGDDQGVLAVADPRLGVLSCPGGTATAGTAVPTMAIIDMTTATS